ncbi:hypothetical protein V8C37DRAFT_378835 [Trichoderma ceciliae]
MPITKSPARDVTKLMGRRTLSNIPKDQRSLLEGENSWAVDVKGGPHGVATVPGHVLETLKEAFIRLRDEEEEESPEEEGNPGLPPTTNDRDERNGPPLGSTPARSGSVPLSSPERPIAWSPSIAGSGHHAEISDPGSPADETPAVPLPAPLTQPQLAQVHGTPTPGPSSSVSEPEDLEMELPQAQENREPPINRIATQIHLAAASQDLTNIVTSMTTTTDTPPCAQPRVPSALYTSSETPTSSVLPTDPIHRRPRRMKPIHFGQDSPIAAGPPTDQAPFTRMPPMRTIPGPNNQTSTSSSSVTSAPDNDRRKESSQDANPQSRTSRHLDEINSLPHDGREASPLWRRPMNQLYRIQAAVDVPISEHMEPYGAYTATYPDYATVHSGNIRCFIQACILLRMFQDDRAIREYLYDDFIRAWSGGYLKYANNAGPGQTPLPAIEWFNMLQGPILFNRMCVNKGNIDTVLNAYPEEVARHRAILQSSEQQEETPASESGPEPGPELEMELEPGLDQEPEPEQEPVVVDLLDSGRALDISVTRQRQRQQPPKTPSAMTLPPLTRKPASLPAPSRTAPPPPPPPPRSPSPELEESDEFDSPPLPPKPQSLPKPQAQPQPRPQSRSRSQSQSHQPQPQPQSKPQPHMQLALPQRQSPGRRSAPAPTPSPASVPASTAPPPSAARRPPKSADAESSPRPAGYLGELVSSGRSVRSSSRRSIPKPRKRSAEERARLKEHFRKKAPSSSSTGLVGRGAEI